MSISFLKFSSIAPCIVLMTVLVSCLPADAKRVLVLTQKTTLAGKHKVLLADDAVKVIDDGKSWTVLATAPDWTVHFYNESTRVMLTRPAKQFRGSYGFGVTVTNGPWLIDLPVKPTNEISEIKGQKVRRYAFKAAGEHIIRAPKDKHEVLAGSANNANVLRANMWVMLGKTPNQSAIISKTYKLPDLGSVPIRLTDMDDTGLWTTELDTLSATWEDVKPQIFEPPKTFKRVKSEQDVSLSAHSDEEIKSIIDELNYPLPKLK